MAAGRQADPGRPGRRAAEIFTAATKPLDPGGRGWTLHQLSAASPGRASHR
ncbi:MAG TPA: hypothetical protein VG164_09080 [Trebonia sp.]|nr:hypothetical protein [Trebonia sp.]